MAGNLQPLDEKFAIVGSDGRPTLYFIQWAQQRQIDITGAITAEQFNELLLAYLAAHMLQEGSGIQITPSGNLSDSPTIAADVQEILDQISTTRGAVIYRGLLGWAALAPGAAGNFLKTNGAGADPAWAAAGGGGGYGFEATPTIPDVSGFTLQNAGTASMANAANSRGIVLTMPSAATNIRFVRKNGAPPAAPYKITARVGYPQGTSSTVIYKGCLIMRNSTSGRILIYGDYNSGQHLFQRWTNYTTFSANSMAPVSLYSLPVLPWMRLVNDGVNIAVERSPDGDNWAGYASEPLATFINAAGGTVDEVGFGSYGATPGFTNLTLFQSFTAV